jgi:cytochrome b561
MATQEAEMAIMNDSARYGAVAQVLHWTTVVLVVVLLGTGKAGLVDAEHPASAAFMWHGSLGVLVLALAAARLLWRLVKPPPEFPSTMTRLGRIAARTMHASLYALIIALPLSGWLAAAAEGSRINFFDVATLPRGNLFGPATDAGQPAALRAQASAGASGEEGENLAKESHELLGDALLVLVSLHLLAALKHEFVDHDGLIRRMLPATSKSAGGGPGPR